MRSLTHTLHRRKSRCMHNYMHTENWGTDYVYTAWNGLDLLTIGIVHDTLALKRARLRREVGNVSMHRGGAMTPQHMRTAHGKLPWRHSIQILGALAALVGALVNAPAWATPASGGGGNKPALVISSPMPASGPAGASVVVSASHWVPGTTVQLSIGSTDGTCTNTTALSNASGQVDSTGAADIRFTWPSTLVAGTYPICGDGPGAPAGGVISSNSYTELTQGTPSIGLPSSATSGQTVTYGGQAWVPGGITVEIYGGPSGNPCAVLLTSQQSQSDGSIGGTFTVPTVTSTTTYTITAVSPQGTCNGSVPATLQASTTFTILASGSGTPPPSSTNTPTPSPTKTSTPNPGSGTPGKGTATPGHGTPPPGSTSVPAPGHGTPGTGTPTETGHGSSGGNGGGNSGPCPPLPNGFCSPNSAFPWWLLCLMVFGLLALFVILLLLLLWRRNQEVIVTEEDITSQIDPNSVAPMGTMRFARAVRVTTQVVDRGTGAVRSSTSRDYDEFTDANSNTHRRPRATP